MFKISKKADYAVLLMARLALLRTDGISTGEVVPASAHEIADRVGLSQPVVANLLKTLTRAGLLDSVRGVSGGYLLARPPAQISLAQILEAIEGPLRLVECAHELPSPNATEMECSLSDHCLSRSAMRVVHDRVARLMGEIRLPELLQHENRAAVTSGTPTPLSR